MGFTSEKTCIGLCCCRCPLVPNGGMNTIRATALSCPYPIIVCSSVNGECTACCVGWGGNWAAFTGKYFDIPSGRVPKRLWFSLGKCKCHFAGTCLRRQRGQGVLEKRGQELAAHSAATIHLVLSAPRPPLIFPKTAPPLPRHKYPANSQVPTEASRAASAGALPLSVCSGSLEAHDNTLGFVANILRCCNASSFSVKPPLGP